MNASQGHPILIIDDDEPTQKLLSALLTRFGYQTEVASKGGPSSGFDRVRTRS